MEIIIPGKLAMVLVIFVFATLYLVLTLTSCASDNISYVIPKVRVFYFIWKLLITIDFNST